MLNIYGLKAVCLDFSCSLFQSIIKLTSAFVNFKNNRNVLDTILMYISVKLFSYYFNDYGTKLLKPVRHAFLQNSESSSKTQRYKISHKLVVIYEHGLICRLYARRCQI